jgi:hypothetical protein
VGNKLDYLFMIFGVESKEKNEEIMELTLELSR